MADQNWIPFRAFTLLEQEMHELVERIGGRSWIDGFGWKPDTDIYRDGDSFVVQAELPGIDPHRDLEVDVVENILQISGHIAQAHDVTETDRFITERRYGPFHREVMLPCGIDPAAVEANFCNGILTVRATLSPETTAEQAPYRIQVKVTEPFTSGIPSVSLLTSRQGPEMGRSKGPGHEAGNPTGGPIGPASATHES